VKNLNIEKELQEYRQNLSKLKYLRKELSDLISPEFFPDSVSYYNSPVFNKPLLSETNKFNSITENAGLKLQAVNKKLEEKQRRLRKEIKDLSGIIYTVDILLESLDNQELFIIKEKYFEGAQWFLVAINYQKIYGQPISPRTLKAKKTIAIKKMERVMR
jgi:hypothetical protein